MNKELRTYLEWRFRLNNINKYQKYRDEWIVNLNYNQLMYFEIEMNRLKLRGQYSIKNY